MSRLLLLAVKDDLELRNPRRIRRLRSRSNFIAVAVCGLMALGCWAGVVLIVVNTAPNGTRDSSYWSGLAFLFFCGLMCAGLCYAIYKQPADVAIRKFLRDPTQFDFIEGNIVRATYTSDGSAASRRVSVQAEGVRSDGTHVRAYERWDTGDWLFGTVTGRGDIRKPVPVYLLASRTGSGPSAIVGMKWEIVEPVLKREKRRQAREFAYAFRIVLLVIAALVVFRVIMMLLGR